MPDLAELCRIHDIRLELVEDSHDVDELLDRLLDENERRPTSTEEARRLRALILFARQAGALKEKAEVATELRRTAEELTQVNGELERSLADEERSRRRLDEVLATLDAGILIVESDGRIRNANQVATELAGAEAGTLVGRPARPLVGEVGRGADGEVHRSGNDGRDRVLRVARRDLPGNADAEVVLLSDVTTRDRAMEERSRDRQHAERLNALAAFSHKINNSLTALMGRAQLLAMQAGTDPDVAQAVQGIEKSAERIAATVRELTSVVREAREEALGG